MVAMDDLAAAVEVLRGRMLSLEERAQANAGAQCVAALPHPNRLTFMRGPNRYLCECGKVYVKGPAGTLKEI